MKFCPLKNNQYGNSKECLDICCAWWDEQNNCCAILTLAVKSPLQIITQNTNFEGDK